MSSESDSEDEEIWNEDKSGMNEEYLLFKKIRNKDMIVAKSFSQPNVIKSKDGTWHLTYKIINLLEFFMF
jgi:hypothetical protein